MPRKKRSSLLILLLALVLLGWVSIGQLSRVVRAEGTPQYQDLELFTDVLSIVRKSYVEEVPMKDLIYGAINGMLASLGWFAAFTLATATPEGRPSARVLLPGETVVLLASATAGVTSEVAGVDSGVGSTEG